MLKATEDFTHAGIAAVKGQEIEPLTWEADEVELLIRAGLLAEVTTTKKAGQPAKEEK